MDFVRVIKGYEKEFLEANLDLFRTNKLEFVKKREEFVNQKLEEIKKDEEE
ncbi:MAG: hypothetical protein KKG75_05335 [Nanoarchaeota archaeon]|nr:hypothetical protein [Nanoarchaeota archaeon]